jgi:hypothetical protein
MLFEYYQELGRQSPRVEYSEYGRSIQGHPLVMLKIGSEANLARAAQIRERIQRLNQATSQLPESELVDLISDTPSIVWIYIVDADEEAGVNVLQELAYDLATKDDEDTRSLRDNVLVVMAPMTNPDAHARYVMWHMLYDVDGASVDPNSVENRAHWGMNTDGNAYGIDLNRDWGWFVTPELRAVAREAMDWRPQLSLDIHSGPNVIFIPPFPPPYHPLWPEQALKWWIAVAEQANENFGPRGWSFYSREYVGHTEIGVSRSWFMLGPAVAGYLYESFGGRPQKTIAFRRDDGTIATMRMAMDRHYWAIWSALQVARDRKEELLRDAHLRVVSAVDAARSNSVRGLVIPGSGPGVDPDKVGRLVERLTVQGVEVRQSLQAFTARAADLYQLETERSHEFPSGSYVVDFVQPQARLARALLDPTLDFSNPEMEVPVGQKMPYSDVTWGNLAYMFGVQSYAVRSLAGVESRAVPGREEVSGQVEGLARAAPPYAYVLPAGRESSYRIAIRLMREGYKLRVFTSSFWIGDTEYGKGTWAALRGRNPDGLGSRMAELSRV